jgi:hypothetical protein
MSRKTAFAGVMAAVLMQIATLAPSSAETPNLSGTYLFRDEFICQVQLVATTSGGFQLAPNTGAQIILQVGTATFTPATPFARSGKFSIIAKRISGSAYTTTIDGTTTGTPMTLAATSLKFTGKYKVGTNSLQLFPKDGSPEPFETFYGQLDGNGTASIGYALRLDNIEPACAEIFHAQRQ